MATGPGMLDKAALGGIEIGQRAASRDGTEQSQ
jgi:hypothetical protein